MSLSLSTKPEVAIPLSLYINSKLEQCFPNDPFSDITIIFVSKNYKLQKAYLRLESEYFAESFESESVTRNQLLIIGKKFEVSLFEKILRCFYGGKAVIHQNEIYSAFEICQYLRSSSLIAQMVEHLVKNFESLNFFMVYSIGFLYSNDELLEKCFTYLRETNFKAMMEEWVYASKPNNKYPNTIYSLSEDSFKNLIRMHNQLKANSNKKDGFLGFQEVYYIIKTYVGNNTNKSEQVVKLKEMVMELIDKNQLNSKEYKLIYHQDLFLVDDEKNVVDYLQNTKGESTQKYSKSGERLDLITSENFLFKKEMEELRNDNTALLGELKILKENFKKSQVNVVQYEEKYNDMLNRCNDLRNELANSQLKAEMRFYKLELMIEELKNEISCQNGENQHNFNRSFSEKVCNSNKFKLKSENSPQVQLNRKSTEETKASRNDLISIQGKEDKMGISMQNHQISRRVTDFSEKTHNIPTYSILKKPCSLKETPLLSKNLVMEEILSAVDANNSNNKEKENLSKVTKECIDLMKKQNGFATSEENQNNQPIEVKNNNPRINELMRNICLEQNLEDVTHESFFFLDKNLNNTILSNTSQIISPNMLHTQSNYQTNYKNTVLIDIKSEFLSQESDFETLKKWFDVKMYQKLKLHLLFRATRDTFKSASFQEKTEGINPILVFFSAQELETEVFGGFSSEHSDQGFVFELRSRVRTEISINREEAKCFLVRFGNLVKILEDGDKERKNVLIAGLGGVIDSDESEMMFTVKEIEAFQVLIDSEMEI